MTPEHAFPEGDGSSVRCVHCGTLREHHERAPQNCVPHAAVAGTVPLRPEAAERSWAVHDQDAIYAGIARLKAEREAVWATIDPEATG